MRTLKDRFCALHAVIDEDEPPQCIACALMYERLRHNILKQTLLGILEVCYAPDAEDQVVTRCCELARSGLKAIGAEGPY